MGIDTKIYLENHANVDKVYDIMAVALGAQTEYYASSRSKKSPDFNEPSSDTNSWNIKVLHDSWDKFEYIRPTYFDLNVKSICGEKFHTLFFYDIDDNTYAQNGERLLNPTSSAAWLSIGKKLVDFFGGKMLISDADDYEDPDNWYKVEKGSYPKEMIDGNDRWYNYINALSKVETLTAKEILDWQDKAAYFGEREENLINHLSKVANFNKLNNELTTDPTTKTRKMKV